MPLEISEIGVRVAVGDPGSPASAEREPNDDQDTEAAGMSPAQMTAIVDRCVEVVLRTLRMREAR
jgi:hypothetical protein